MRAVGSVEDDRREPESDLTLLCLRLAEGFRLDESAYHLEIAFVDPSLFGVSLLGVSLLAVSLLAVSLPTVSLPATIHHCKFSGMLGAGHPIVYSHFF